MGVGALPPGLDREFEMQTDTHGQKISETYRVISEPSFERRLKAFDPRLKLMFDQKKERWVILEAAYDNSGWNIILKAEDRNGNPKPLGEWVFNSLYVKRKRWEALNAMGAEKWLQNLKDQALDWRASESRKISEDHQAQIRDDIWQWRRAAKEIQNLPTADAKPHFFSGVDFARKDKV